MVSNSKEPIKCASLNNQPCQARLTLDINSNKTLLYTYTVSFNKCCGSCNTIDDLYARFCVPNKAKNMILKVYNLIPGANEKKDLVQHELCECKCELNESVCNSLQKLNHDECRHDCKELMVGLLVQMIIYGIPLRDFRL